MIFCQKYQMICRIGDARFVLIEAGAGRNVCLDADDGFDMCLMCGRIEFYRPEHIAVVGHRDRRTYPARRNA